MASILGMPRPESKFVDADGRISRDWYFFLSYILQQVGGPAVVSGGGVAPLDVQKQYEEYPLTNPDAEEALRGVDELRNELASTRGEMQSLRVILDDLAASLSAPTTPTDFRNRIESIEDRLA